MVRYMDDGFKTKDKEINNKIDDILNNRIGMKPNDVVDVCNEIIEFGLQIGDEMSQLFGYYYKAEVYMRTSLVYDKILLQDWMNKGILLCEKVNHMEYLVKFYNLRGSFFSWFEDYVTSIETYKMAVRLCDQCGFEEMKGKLIGNMAIIYSAVGDYQESIEFLLESVKAPIDTDVEMNFWNKVLQLYYLADAYLELNEIEMAYINQMDIENLTENMPAASYYRFGVLVLFCRIAIKRKNYEQVKQFIKQITNSEERINFVGIYDSDAFHYIHLLVDYEMQSGENMTNEIEFILMKMQKVFDTDNPTIHQKKQYLQELMLFYQRSNQDQLYKTTAKQLLDILDEGRIDYGENLLTVVQIRTELKEMKLKQYKESYRTMELEHQTKHDDLTQLLNRRGLEYFADKWRDYAYQGSKMFVVGMIDIDSFKKLNDEYGHLHGDRCLAMLGKVLEERQSERILAARFGGDEFVVIFWDIEFQEVVDFAEELKRKMLTVETGIKLSQGYAARIPQEQMKPWDYLNRADTMLYEVKQASGNNYKIYWEK